MMWCNSYAPPAVRDKPAVDGLYDINCAIPLDLAALENERVKLTLFIPRLHAVPFLEQVKVHPQLYDYLPFPLPNTLEDLDAFLETKFSQQPGNVLFAIHDKTRPSNAFDTAVSGGGSFAGTIALINTSISDLRTELGVVVIFPDFQKTHVLSNAAGLLLRYCLNLASDARAPGLGYRRVQWLANAENERSIGAATRLGFQKEGVIRWHRALPEEKVGLKPREGDPSGLPGRHTVILSICWDDWTSGVRDKLEVTMSRK